MHPHDEQRLSQRRLQNYLIPQCGVGMMIGLAAITGGALLESSALVLGGIVTLLYTLGLLPALVLARRGRLRAAVWIAVTGLYLIAIAATLVAPVVLSVVLIVTITAPVVALPYIEQRDLRVIAVMSIAVAIVAALLGRFVALFPPLPEPITSVLIVFTAGATTALLLLLLFQFAQQLSELLARANTANRELQATHAELETLVAQRTADLRTALVELEERTRAQAQLLAENQRQRAEIADLSVPILPVASQVLVMPLVGTLDSSRLALAEARALQGVEHRHTRCLILDITGVPLVDAAVAAGLMRIVQAARLLGTQVVLVGIRPEVAQTVVGLGIDLSQLITRSDLQSGIAYALGSTANRPVVPASGHM